MSKTIITIEFDTPVAAAAALALINGSIAAAPAPAAAAQTKAEKPSKTEKAAAPAPAPVAASKHTRDEMDAAISEVNKAAGTPEAKRIIKEAGGVEKKAEIPDSKIDAVYDACKALLAAPAEEDI